MRLPRTQTATGALLCASLLLLSACALGPDYERPIDVLENIEGESWTQTDDESPKLDREAVEPWWRTFGDDVSVDLVEEALEANTDLRAAAARVIAAQATLRRAEAAFWPQASVGAGVNETRNSFVLPTIGRVSTDATTWTADLNVSYQADLFGRLRRSEQAAWSSVLAQEAARESLAHTVVAETVRARVRLATLQRSLDVASGIRDSWADTVETTENRYERGLLGTLELRLARENLAAAEANAVRVESELERARLGLDVLLGRRPGAETIAAAGLNELPALDAVPLGLPAELLDRRPDLRAAEMRLAGATAQIGVAMADLYPDLTLNGNLGGRSDKLADVLSNEIFTVAGQIVGVIFDRGRRKAGVEIARAQAEEAAAEYAGAVLGALREVEDALIRDSALQEQLDLARRRVEEARAADDIARRRYERGVQNLLAVLETERRLRLAEESLVSTQAELWNARIDLHLALGGDWQTSQEQTSPNQTAQENS